MTGQLARVLLADPPWAFRDRLPGAGRGAARNYEVLSLEQICDFPLPPLAPHAWLFLWRVSSQVEQAYQVVRAWGFQPRTERVWCKLTKAGKPWFGMGHSFRAAHETCIVAVRGRPKPLVRNIRSTLTAKVPVDADGNYLHSAKPEQFQDDIERMCRAPYVELFARRRRLGWHCFGDELPALEIAA